MLGYTLAKQVPTIYSNEHIRDKFYPEYDPETMGVLFLSSIDFIAEPASYRNALFMIIHGQVTDAEGTHAFYRVYTNDGALQALHEFTYPLGTIPAKDKLLHDLTELMTNRAERELVNKNHSLTNLC